MNPGRRSFRFALAVVAAVALIAGCSPIDVPSQAPSAAATPPASTAAPTASAAPGDTTIIQAYFYMGGELGAAGLLPVVREVPQTQAVGEAAMNAMLSGPTGEEGAERAITSAVPAGSRLLGLSIENGVATVDLSREFESGGGSLSMFVRLGQVVYTLTQFPTVQSVAFKIEGEPVTDFSSEGIVLNGPVGRDGHEDLLPAIFVERPGYGASLGNPARINGSANVFEATFLVAVLDGAGATIAQQQVMATCGTGCRGTFDVTLAYSVPSAGWGTLRAWDGSAKDGSPENVREYRVWLTPAE